MRSFNRQTGLRRQYNRDQINNHIIVPNYKKSVILEAEFIKYALDPE